MCHACTTKTKQMLTYKVFLFTYNNATGTSVLHAVRQVRQAASVNQVHLRHGSTGQGGALTVREILYRTRIWMNFCVCWFVGRLGVGDGTGKDSGWRSTQTDRKGRIQSSKLHTHTHTNVITSLQHTDTHTHTHTTHSHFHTLLTHKHSHT